MSWIISKSCHNISIILPVKDKKVYFIKTVCLIVAIQNCKNSDKPGEKITCASSKPEHVMEWLPCQAAKLATTTLQGLIMKLWWSSASLNTQSDHWLHICARKQGYVASSPSIYNFSHFWRVHFGYYQIYGVKIYGLYLRALRALRKATVFKEQV